MCHPCRGNPQWEQTGPTRFPPWLWAPTRQIIPSWAAALQSQCSKQSNPRATTRPRGIIPLLPPYKMVKSTCFHRNKSVWCPHSSCIPHCCAAAPSCWVAEIFSKCPQLWVKSWQEKQEVLLAYNPTVSPKVSSASVHLCCEKTDQEYPSPPPFWGLTYLPDPSLLSSCRWVSPEHMSMYNTEGKGKRGTPTPLVHLQANSLFVFLQVKSVKVFSCSDSAFYCGGLFREWYSLQCIAWSQKVTAHYSKCRIGSRLQHWGRVPREQKTAARLLCSFLWDLLGNRKWSPGSCLLPWDIQGKE